jgi:hypothetical protein
VSVYTHQQPSPRDPNRTRIERRVRDGLDDLDALLEESRLAGERFIREVEEMQHRLGHLAETLPENGEPPP